VDEALIKIIVDMGAMGVALCAMGYAWVHVRDDRILHDTAAKQLAELESQLALSEALLTKQETANRLSAVADQNIMAELVKLATRMEALSTRLDTTSNTVVELRADLRHLANRRSAG
jgi:hypothetical protein